MIKIGDKSFKTRRPAKLDEELAGRTGMNAAETAAYLERGGLASHVASALHPFIDDPSKPSQGELAAAIANSGELDAIRGQVLALYGAAEASGADAASAKA